MISKQQAKFKSHSPADALKPFFVFKQVQLAKKSDLNSLTYMASTFDRKLFLIELSFDHSKLKSREEPLKINSIVSEIYFNPNNRRAYVGYVAGHIEELSLQAASDQSKPCLYLEAQTSPDRSIVLLYVRHNNIYAWDIGNEVKMVEILKMSLIRKCKLESHFTAGLAFEDPFTYKNVGCVAFKNGRPPVVFDCQVGPQIKNAYELSVETYAREDLDEGEIVVMAQDQRQVGKSKIIACGVEEKGQCWVSFYQLNHLEKNALTYLDPLFRIEISRPSLHICLKDEMALISVWQTFYFIDVNTRAKLLKLGKQCEIVWGFIVNRTEKDVTFMLEKGFYYKKPNEGRMEKPKIRVKTKDIDSLL